MDAIASGGTRFTRISAQVPLTLPSHVSLLTSTYPFSNGIRDNGQTLGTAPVTLAALLKSRGYRTGAFVASFVLDRRFGLNRGFDEYNGAFDLRRESTTDPGNIKRPGEEVVRAASEWALQNASQPFFLFLHLYDLHTPYRIPQHSGRLTYDDVLSYEDSVIGTFWDSLSKQSILDRALIVFTADHGEGLGDHGESTHGFFVYQSTLWVPLIIRWPRGFIYPATIAGAAGLIDVAPTIVDYLGVPKPREFQGRSLMALIRREAPGFAVYSESNYAKDHFGCSSLVALSDGNYKYIESSKPELYDLSRDPGERSNLSESRKPLAFSYRDRIRAFTASYHSITSQAKQQPSPEAFAKLRSLGYLGGASSGPSTTNSAPAPTERIETWEAYSRALALASAGHVSKAAQIMQEMLRALPELADVRLSLGLLWQQLGRPSDAAAEFRRLLQRDPKNAIAHFNLGLSLQTMGQSGEAAKEFETALRLAPNYTRAEEVLAGLLLDRRRFNEAQAHYEHILIFDPAHFGGHYNLGVLAASRDRWDDAQQHLEAALRSDPGSAEAHNVLGSIYFRKGELSSARREFEEAIRLAPKMSMAHYNLGLVLRKQGDRSGALEKFRTALACDPRNQAARAALSRQN